MNRASIDLGTNTCLLLIVAWDSQNKKIDHVIEDRSTFVRLGEGVDQARSLSEAAMARTMECLKNYRDLLNTHGVDSREVICVATSQARDAKNGAAFFSRIQSEIGLSFEVLSGDAEAKMSFEGALDSSHDFSKQVVIDIGGGSTEIVTQSFSKSIDMGAVRFTERFLKSDPVEDQEFWACQRAIDDELGALRAWRLSQVPDLNLVGVAGTVVTLARWFLGESIETKFDSEKVSKVRLTRGDLHRMVEELKWRTVAERKKLPGIEPGRADVILAGSLILWRVCEVLSFPEVFVSARGLRYGIIRR